jgi:hypothetical protein
MRATALSISCLPSLRQFGRDSKAGAARGIWNARAPTSGQGSPKRHAFDNSSAHNALFSDVSKLLRKSFKLKSNCTKRFYQRRNHCELAETKDDQPMDIDLTMLRSGMSEDLAIFHLPKNPS